MSNKLYRPSADETDAAAALLITRRPTEAKRYRLATEIVIAGAVSHIAGHGWIVASQKHAGTNYLVSDKACTCYDFRHSGGGACKHMHALSLFGKVIATKLQEMMPVTPLAAYYRSLNANGCEADAAAFADAVCADPIIGDDKLFALPVPDGSGGLYVYDRVTGDDIMTVAMLPSGAWRPATADDTLAWAAWLGAHQVGEEEGVTVAAEPVTPDPAPRTLAAVLAGLGDGEVVCDLKQDWGTHTYTLEAYRYTTPGALRVVIPVGERVTLSEYEFGCAIVGANAAVQARSRGQGFTYHYVFGHPAADGSTAFTRGLEAARLLATQHPEPEEHKTARNAAYLGSLQAQGCPDGIATMLAGA